MATPTKNIELTRDSDYSVVGEFKDDNGNNIDISGDSFKAQVRDFCGAGSVVLAEFTFIIFQDANDIDPNTNQGKWKYERIMLKAEVNAIPVINTGGVWDQFQTFPDTLTVPNLTGTVEIKCNATDPTS